MFNKTIVFLVDVMIIMLSSILALLLRFDFSISQIGAIYMETIFYYLPINIVCTIFILYFFRLYHSLWLFAGITEVQNIFISCVASSIIQVAGITLLNFQIPRSYYFLYGVILFVLTLASRFAYRVLHHIHKEKKTGTITNVMIVGGGEATNIILKEIRNSNKVHNTIVKCIIDDDPKKQGRYINGVRVQGTRDHIIEYASVYKIDEIIISMPSVSKKNVRELVSICNETKCNIKILPGIYQLVNGEMNLSKIRKVEIEDLLGRDTIKLDLDLVSNYVRGKVILVTGGGGSIGSELCRQIAANHPKQLIIVDIYENTTYEVQQELKRKFPNLDLVVLIATITNIARLNQIFAKYRPDIVYHAAAHKHVPLMEESPNEAIKNNVIGTWNTVLVADQYGVERFVMISTDKAVNPTNIMGASKRICEMIISTYNKHSKTEYVAVRFGNVLGSNGSVIPLFKNQIAAGGPVTVTHPDIVRYFMTIPEAVSLVLQAGASAKGGEIFILDMGEPVKILELAKNLIQLSGLKPNEDIMITFTGLRPGEKMYEELLLNKEETMVTENKLIHIEKPLEINEEKFLKQLDKLKILCFQEPENIRRYIKEIVPSYCIQVEKDKEKIQHHSMDNVVEYYK